MMCCGPYKGIHLEMSAPSLANLHVKIDPSLDGQRAKVVLQVEVAHPHQRCRA